MYCVIQKIINKKPNTYGGHKELLTSITTYTINNVTKTMYNYRYSDSRFERQHMESYRVCIQKSYRENGRVKTKQWVICTVSYYDIADGNYYWHDYLLATELKTKLEEMGIDESKLGDMIDSKLEPIADVIKAEIQATEEYKAKLKHSHILNEYRKSKLEFEKKYGTDEYQYCYDVFGVLQNESYLKELKTKYKAQQEYQKKSSSYSSKQSNYSNYYSSDSSSSYAAKFSNYNEDDKAKLKKCYKALAKNFHPDISKDDGEMMKFVNTLKDAWGV